MATNPDATPPAKPGAKPPAKPGARPAAHVDQQAAAKPAVKGDGKPAPRPGARPAAGGEEQAAAKPAVKGDGKPAAAGVKLPAKAGSKPVARTNDNQILKHDGKPAAQTRGQPAPTPEQEAVAEDDDDQVEEEPKDRGKGKKKGKAAKVKGKKKPRSAQTPAWGIDIGQCALKAVRLQNVDGQVVATAFDYVEYPKILSQPDAEPDDLIKDALQKFLSRNQLRGDIVAISVPGQSGLARFVKLPPVEEKKVADIVRFEAKQQIPFSLDEVVWDYQRLGSGDVSGGYAMEIEIGLFAMKRDVVNRYLERFREVNVDVHVVQMAPLALCNFASFDLLGKGGPAAEPPAEDGATTEGSEEEKKCVVALDIGADSTNLVITDGDRIIWQRPIAIGGNTFTRALIKELKLTFAKAEHLKRHATRSPYLTQILAALKPVLTDFVSEVQRSLGYFANTHHNAQIAYMMGLGNAFRLPGLQRFLENKLGLEVRKLAKFELMGGSGVISAPAFANNILGFAVAYGLALQGMKVARLQTNLLPPEIEAARLIRTKKPWALSAAAVLLLATTILTVGYSREYRGVAAPDGSAIKSGLVKLDLVVQKRQ